MKERTSVAAREPRRRNGSASRHRLTTVSANVRNAGRRRKVR
jgi:hypothetical protein